VEKHNVSRNNPSTEIFLSALFLPRQKTATVIILQNKRKTRHEAEKVPPINQHIKIAVECIFLQDVELPRHYVPETYLPLVSFLCIEAFIFFSRKQSFLPEF